MERVFGYVPRDLTHNARFGRIAKLLYTYHPLFDAKDTALEVVEVRSDMLVVRLANGSRRGIPAWMFNEVDCCEIRSSATPVVSPESLLEIAKLLDLSGLNIRSEGDEPKLQSDEGCDGQLTTDTNKPAVRRIRKRKTDRQSQETSVRGTDQRVDRDRRAKSPSSRRRGR